MTGITFTVFGVAQAKGSARAFIPKGWKRPIITSSNPGVKAWESLVAEAASRALSGRGMLFHGPVKLTMAFFLPRPKSAPRRLVAMTKRPDAGKLARSTEDALSGVLYRDDAQITELHVVKAYADVGESARAIVTLEPLDPAERLFFEAAHGENTQSAQTEESQLSPDRPAE